MITSLDLVDGGYMGRLFVVNLEGKLYSCKRCKAHLALCEDIVSESFYCRHGKAYLFSKVYMDGFFQETGHEKNQKYKEGKSVLERCLVLMEAITGSAMKQVGGSDADDD
ncbi:hypothetical protein CRYUN_Cryun09bG0108900 [Craigia yunnanensis]